VKLSDKDYLTVIFPLHRALQWIDIISENIKLCPQNCQIIISDRTLLDNAVLELKKRHQNDARIIFLDKVGPAGWREHVNWLLPMLKTELFSIMPQDDSITPLYYQRLVDVMIKKPQVSLTFGPIVAHNFENNSEPVQFESLPFNTELRPTWVEAIELEQNWNLGIAYRGVIRRNLAQPIAATISDQAADIIWVFGIALRGYLTEVSDAVYHKRYHADSAHVGWRTLTVKERYNFLRRELFRQLSFKPIRLIRAQRLLRNTFDSLI
jgi:hypothetical protein